MFNAGGSKHGTHTPITITKAIDKSTPLLGQALSKLEKLHCVLSFYRASSHGAQEKFYTLELKGAVIARLSTSMPHTVLYDDLEAEEVVAIRYREISWTHHIAGTSGYAFWGDDE